MKIPNNIDITSLNETDRKRVYDFFLSVSETSFSGKSDKKSNDTEIILPDEFYKPIKIKEYEEFKREEVYGK